MTTLCLSCKQDRNVDSINMSYCCHLFLKNRPPSNGQFNKNALKFSQQNKFLFDYDFCLNFNHL